MSRIFPGSAAIARRSLCAAALISSLSGDLAARGQPPGAFDWGFRLRLRQEYLANAYDLSEATADDYNYIRVRSQLWGAWSPNDQWKLFAMLNNEHRHWFKSNKGLEDRDFELHEVIFENLYLEGKKLGGTPFGFVLGRQNLFYGEGLLCWDGGPLDGSRTAYFNALLLTAAFEKRRFEAHILSDPERDDYLPVINNQEQALIERDETGAGLYYTDESFAGRKIEAYYFYKNEKYGDIHTLGARASGKAAEKLSFALEGAMQLGDYLGHDRLAFGGYATARYSLPVETTPLALSAGAIYLSGDDHTTDRYGGWNPIYSRWPKWSELYIYTLTKDPVGRPAYWQNVASGWFGLDFTPAKRCTLEGRLYMMWAPEAVRWNYCGPSCLAISWESDDFDYRGTLSTLKLNVRVNTYLEGHLLWEMFKPGAYYDQTEHDPTNDTAHFLRWEILFKY